MRLFLCGCAAFAILTCPTFAYFCSEPSAPYCVNSYGAFNDGYDFEDCKRDVEQYAAEIEDYLGCLSDESEQAISNYNNAVESFNRRVRSY